MSRSILILILLGGIITSHLAWAFSQNKIYQWSDCNTAEKIIRLAVDLDHPDPIWGISLYSVYRMDGRKGFWRPAGLSMPSQDLSAIAASSEGAGTVYVGTKTGMIYKYSDAQGEWRSLASLGSGWNKVKAINVSRVDPRIVYAATERFGLFVSRDSGQTWQATPLTPWHADAVVAHPARPETAICLYEDGLYRSDDYGTSWNRLSTPEYSSNWDFAIESQPPYRIYLLSGQGTLSASDDLGSHWTFLVERTMWSIFVDPLRAGRIFTANKDFIQESTDGGLTWRKIRQTGGAESLIVDPHRSGIVYIDGPVRGIQKPVESDWQTSGPLGGDIRAIRPDRFTQGRIWVGLASKVDSDGSDLVESYGIYQSPDHGTNWLPVGHEVLPPALSPPEAVGDLIIAPSAPLTMVGIQTHRLVLTMDGGNTWDSCRVSYDEPEIRSLAIHPENPQIMYAGTEDGLYKTTDFGTNWLELASSPQTVIQSILIHPDETGTIYTSTFDMGVWKTTDAGESWNYCNQGLPEYNVVDLAFSAVNKRVLYAATRSQGLYRSTDAGASWERRSIDFGSPLNDVEVDPLRAARVYVATEGAGVFRSDDAGQHWQQLTDGLTNLNIQCIAADPLVPEIVYAGASFAGLFRSSDAGRTWAHSGIRPASAKSVRIDRVEGNIVYAGTYTDGLYISEDWGVSWEPLPTNLPSQSVMMVGFDHLSPTNLYVSIDGKGLFRTADQGQTWSPLNNGLNPQGDSWFSVTGFAASPHIPNVLYAGAEDTALVKSTDSGSNWVPQSFGYKVSNIQLDPLAPNRMYLISFHRPYRSFDGGRYFSLMADSTAEFRFLTMHPWMPTWLYLYGYGGSSGSRILVSNDSGSSWISVPPGRCYVRDIEPLRADPKIFYTCGSNNNGREWNNANIARYTNLGQSWQPCMGIIPPCVIWDLEVHPSEPGLIYAATDYGVFHRLFLGSGDVDDDGTFSASDYDALGKFLTEDWSDTGECSLEVIEPMDTDGNGRVNIVDLVVLKARLNLDAID